MRRDGAWKQDQAANGASLGFERLLAWLLAQQGVTSCSFLTSIIHLAQPASLPASQQLTYPHTEILGCPFTSWFISSHLTVQHGSTPQPSTSAGGRSPGLATMVRKGGERPGVSSRLACDKSHSQVAEAHYKRGRRTGRAGPAVRIRRKAALDRGNRDFSRQSRPNWETTAEP